MEPWQIIGLVFGGILAVAGAINTIGAAAEKIGKAVRAAKAPNDEQNERIEKLESVTEELQREADRIKQRLDKRDDGMIVVYEAMLALLGHGIDGNNVAEMKEAKQKIQAYLISK